MASPKKNSQKHSAKMNKPQEFPQGIRRTSSEKGKKQQYKQSDAPQNSKNRTAPAGVRNQSEPANAAIRLIKNHHIFFYGRHAVEAALLNPRRECHRLILSDKADQNPLDKLPDALKSKRARLITQILPRALFGSIVGETSPHQDMILEVSPIASQHIDDINLSLDRAHLILMLDQVTDPQNFGAIIRSAAALGASAVISQDRHSPHETGALARAASGGLEVIPWLRVTNLSQTLDHLKKQDFWSIGLDGQADDLLSPALAGKRIVLVLGSEGQGIRPLVAKHCDILAKIPMTGLVESLNVASAAAISLFALRTS